MFAHQFRTTNQTMLSGKCKPHVLLLLCLCTLFAACNDRSQNHLNTPTDTCDTTIASRYKAIVAQATDPVKLVDDIKVFYTGVPEKCHKLIARKVMEDLFDLAYGNPSMDTLVLPFLKKISTEPTLSLDLRTKAMFFTGGYYLYARKNTEEALVYISQAYKANPHMNDTLAKTYNSLMGQVTLQQSKLHESSKYYLKAIEFCEKVKDSVSLAGNYSNYATVFSTMGDHPRSIEMRKRAMVFFNAQNNNNNLFIGYVGIGNEFGEMHTYDSALNYYMKALDLTEKGVKNPTVEFDLQISLAGIFTGKNDYDRARYFYGKAKNLLTVLPDEAHERVYTMASTAAFAQVRNVDEEIGKINSYIPGYFQQNDISSAKDAYYCLFHVYYVQSKYALALDNYQTFDSLKNILTAEDNNKYVAEMETKYETQKKELKIQVQRKELTQKNVLNGFLLALLGTLIMAAAFLITRYRLRKNRKDAALQQKFTRQLMENTEEERVRIARDLHDGVSQELLVLKHQIKNTHEDTNEKIDFIINEIRMISRDLHPVMLDKIGLKSSVQHICEQMMETNMFFITADIEYSNGLGKNGELQLFRMIQEALNNIVKYAGAQAAKVTVTETDKYVYAEIMDNGKGFDVQAAMNSKTSFGLLSLTERSKALNGKTDIQSSATGTIVKIEIPKSNV
jgi:two-component system NarL family sensor kinase